MAPDLDHVRVRLIQVRDLEHIEREEQQTFLDRCGIRPDQLLATNVLRERLDDGLLEGVDAVMIGGAGAHSVVQRYAWTDDLVRLIDRIDELDMPLFGSCWGHQFIGFAYGGTVIYDADRAEIGCGWVQLTEQGEGDSLFRSFPTIFRANMGHHDRISVLPSSAEEIATNDVSPFQALRIRGKPIYGTQFHSELDAEAERTRLAAYYHLYPEIGGEEGYRRIVDSLAETTEVDGLLRRFLETFAVEPKTDAPSVTR